MSKKIRAIEVWNMLLYLYWFYLYFFCFSLNYIKNKIWFLLSLILLTYHMCFLYIKYSFIHLEKKDLLHTCWPTWQKLGIVHLLWSIASLAYILMGWVVNKRRNENHHKKNKDTYQRELETSRSGPHKDW